MHWEPICWKITSILMGQGKISVAKEVGEMVLYGTICCNL